MLLPVSMVPVKGPVPLRSLIADEDSLKLLADLQLNNSESIVLHNGVCVKQIADRDPPQAAPLLVEALRRVSHGLEPPRHKIWITLLIYDKVSTLWSINEMNIAST